VAAAMAGIVPEASALRDGVLDRARASVSA